MTDFVRSELPKSLCRIEEQFLLHAEYALSGDNKHDYMTYRECFHHSLRQVVGKTLLYRASKQVWFDSKWVDEDTLIDLCLNQFVLQPHSLSV